MQEDFKIFPMSHGTNIWLKPSLLFGITADQSILVHVQNFKTVFPEKQKFAFLLLVGTILLISIESTDLLT